MIFDSSFIFLLTLYLKTHGRSLFGNTFFGLDVALKSSNSKVSGYTIFESGCGAVRTDSGVLRTECRDVFDAREIDLDADFGRTSE